jgi:hypothetical protein
MSKITKDQKANYLRLALAMSGISVVTEVAELILTINEGINEKGDKFSIRDASKIEADIQRKYEQLRENKDAESKESV